MSRLRLISIAAACAAALSLVACGDTAENNDYVDQVNEVQTTFADDIEQLSANIDSPEQLVELYDTTAQKLDEAVAKLDEIEPPEEVVDLHDQLVSEVQDLANLLQGTADDVKAGGVAAVPGAVSKLASEAGQIESDFSNTISEINSELGG